ncbi:MAG: response regulator [Bacteroidales bacterium]|nr:response regulator [Bacteroidales bacterium]
MNILFSIPYEKVEIAHSPKKQLKKARIPNLTGKTLIIAEDDETNFDLLQTLVLKTNATILHATNGDEVLNLLHEYPETEMILMDIKMPVMNGIETTKKIREVDKQIPIIAVTAYALKEEKMRSFDAGCNDYISKPIVVDELYQKLDSFL